MQMQLANYALLEQPPHGATTVVTRKQQNKYIIMKI
jgi:hypothetical protein